MVVSSLLLSSLLLTAAPVEDPCQRVFSSGFETSDSLAEPECATLSGYLLDRSGASGLLVPDVPVLIRLGSDPSMPYRSTRSDGQGEYRLGGVPTGMEIIVAVEPDGLSTDAFGGTIRLFPTSRRLILEEPVTTRLDFALTGSFENPFDPTTAVSLTQFGTGNPADPAAGEVDIPANALQRGDGMDPQNGARVFLIPFDPTADQSSFVLAGGSAFPGTMEASETGGGATDLSSLGAMAVEFYDGDGEPINLAPGQSAQIRIPVPESLRADAPATIPLWWFDVEAGLWREEGTAALSADRTFYGGSVDHFTNWNADIPTETASVIGEVQWADGTSVPGAWLNISGLGYGYQTHAVANTSGVFGARARRGFSISIEVVVGSYRERLPAIPIPDAATANLGILQLALNPIDPNDQTRELTAVFDRTETVSFFFAPGLPNYEFHGNEDAEITIFSMGDGGMDVLRVEPPFGGEGGSSGPPPYNYGIQQVPGVTFDEFIEAPEGGYMRACFGQQDPNCIDLPEAYRLTPVDGMVYAARNRAGFYSKFTLISAEQDGDGKWTIVIRYEINSSGGRDFTAPPPAP